MTKTLNFASAGLYGREAELQTLSDAYKRACDPECNCSFHAVLVHGVSGAGKSALIERWIQETNKEFGYFVSGKFDQQQATEPYHALAVALNELCDLIFSSPAKGLIMDSFKDEVGIQGKVLLNVVPNLDNLMNIEGSKCRDASTPSTTCLKQLKYVLRAFLRSVCIISEQPIVLFLDDLQWADEASLELIYTILSDSQLNRMLFLGSYRDNEVANETQFAVFLSSIEKQKGITNIHLGDLDPETVNALISDVTELSPSTTIPLTDIVCQKTHGNIFFVLQFLRMLQQEKFLYFSMTKFRWEWDIAKIKSQTDLSENVADLMATEIKRLPAKAQDALQLASCLWSTFDATLLHQVISTLSEKFKAESIEYDFDTLGGLVALLDRCADQGLLDKLDKTRYKFAHDHIQQAAHSLVAPDSDRYLLQQRWLGELLWEMADSERREEWMFFSAVDQLNRSSSLMNNTESRVELARRNLEVGEKAIALSAFIPATIYLKAGIAQLPQETKWTQQYSLSLKLHNKLACMEYCNGNSKQAKIIVDEIVANTADFRDGVQALYTLGLSYSSHKKDCDAIELACLVLSRLGESIPRRISRATVALEQYKMRRMLRGRSDDDLLSVSVMTDKDKIDAMKFYDLAHTCWVRLGKMLPAARVAMKMMRLSLDFGLCELSPVAYSIWGTILAGEGDIEEGYRLGKLSLKLVERPGFLRTKPRVIMTVSSVLSHWREPLQQSIDPILSAHKIAMAMGDTVHAFQHIVRYQSSYFYSGLPLSSGVQDSMAFLAQMEEYGQTFAQFAQRIMLQLMLNLMGRAENVLELTGEVMNQNLYLSLTSNPEQSGVQTIDSCRMQLAYYFGDLELAGRLSRKLQNISKDEKFPSSYLHCARATFFGLISIALARESNRRKHAVNAAKIIAKMEKTWVKRGAVNCLHKLLLLKAEYGWLKCKQKDEVKAAYDMAISTARRVGLIQDEALANERVGLYFLQFEDEYLASSYLSRAHELYSEWGTQAKLDQLEQRHGSLLTKENRAHCSSYLRGRPRFNDSSSKRHKSLRGSRLVF